MKKQTSRLRRVNEQTPCWNFFEIPQGDERVATCKKCSAVIACMDKRGELTTTALNTHLRRKHGNQLDVGATLLFVFNWHENRQNKCKYTNIKVVYT